MVALLVATAVVSMANPEFVFAYEKNQATSQANDCGNGQEPENIGCHNTYTEQIIWRDAATGKILAASDFFPAMSPGILVTPGYGVIIYEMLYNGHVMALQVAPAVTNMGNSTNVGNN